MKLNHKLIMVSAAALMSVSPLVANTQNSVQAATTTKSSSKTTAKKTTTSTKKTTDSKSNSKSTSSKTTSKASSNNITLARNAYVYDKNGKRVKNYLGTSYIGKKITVKGLGTKTINGVKYYALQPNHYYIKASDVTVK